MSGFNFLFLHLHCMVWKVICEALHGVMFTEGDNTGNSDTPMVYFQEAESKQDQQVSLHWMDTWINSFSVTVFVSLLVRDGDRLKDGRRIRTEEYRRWKKGDRILNRLVEQVGIQVSWSDMNIACVISASFVLKTVTDRLLLHGCWSSVKIFQTPEQGVLELNQFCTELNWTLWHWTHLTRADNSRRQLNSTVVNLKHSRTAMKEPAMMQTKLAGLLWWEEVA